ncbi:hypothetical protein BC936DRAFT_140044 [Jimgerdemannia flammicorona]|uniref:Uncharacterized protein n=1 Tax=Jimgerdemannia flammicorona TaxID=994334 RepID=A0A433B474_9FUNG|nr:hypothetical protein BC936DRAFT_140044 [Jimgerdemannia flammicorona]
MTEHEAVELFRQNLRPELATCSKAIERDIVNKLGRIPLAIPHARYFVNQREMPLKEFLKLICQHPNTMNEFFSRSYGKCLFSWDAPLAWDMWIGEIQTNNPLAWHILVVLSFILADGIHVSFFQQQYGVLQLGDVAGDVPAAIEFLISKSCIKKTPFNVLYMDPVIQRTIRYRSGLDFRLQVERIVSAIASHPPSRPLLRQIVARLVSMDGEHACEFANLIHSCIKHLVEYDTAKGVYRIVYRAVRIIENKLAPPQFANALLVLARCQHKLGFGICATITIRRATSILGPVADTEYVYSASCY